MREREGFLDGLRIMATCAVVLLHTITGVMDITDMEARQAQRDAFLVILDLIGWCVPVFLIISGYLFLNPKRELTMGKMLSKYCVRIALALFVFGVPYACLEQMAAEGRFGPDMLWTGFLMVLRGESWAHMWYLYLIFFLYLLTPGMKRLLAVLSSRVVFALLVLLFIISSLLPYSYRFLGLEWELQGLEWCVYLFYYACGYLFAARESACGGQDAGKRGRLAASSSVWLYAAAVLVAACMVSVRLTGVYGAPATYNYPFTVVFSLLIFGIGKSSRRDRPYGVFQSLLARLSFAVYLLHPLFLNIAYKFFHITPLDFPIGISLPLFFMAVLLLALTAAWLLHGIPLLRKYVL